mgnify:FL=1|tara:strand:+ start:2764 stop:3762 length:999 start_codon:yes stop_codon:yes gene_type:complete
MQNKQNKESGISVLSLFDGISCGQIALERAGIKVDKYFASEIDKHAINVTQSNYPNTTQLGDATKIKGSDLPEIFLLMGGSPCQGFSQLGKQLNFEDPRSKLLFEFVRLLKEVRPKYFLLENVIMKKEYRDTISGLLGVEPITIDSALVSSQSRKRSYWTNIPNIEQPEDKGLVINDIVDASDSDYKFIADPPQKGRRATKNYLQYDVMDKGHQSASHRAYLPTSKMCCLRAGSPHAAKILMKDGKIRYTTRLESEKLQTVPLGYTKNVSLNQSKRMLGNGWTVDVIAHILKNVSSDEALIECPDCGENAECEQFCFNFEADWSKGANQRQS